MEAFRSSFQAVLQKSDLHGEYYFIEHRFVESFKSDQYNCPDLEFLLKVGIPSIDLLSFRLGRFEKFKVRFHLI
mgnify:CR=1 FL=1